MIERPLAQGQFDQLGVVQLRMAEHRVVRLVVPAAGGVRQQVMDGDLVDMRMVRRPAEIEAQDGVPPEHPVAKRHAAVLDQRKYRDRGDRFGHAGDAEQIVRRDGFAPFAIGPSDRLLINDPSAVADSDRERRNVVLLHVVAGEIRHRAAFGLRRFRYVGRRLAENRRRQGGCSSPGTQERPTVQAAPCSIGVP